MRKRSVLITGATGFIGRSTVKAFQSAGWDVTQAVRVANSIDDIVLDLEKPSDFAMLSNKKPLIPWCV